METGKERKKKERVFVCVRERQAQGSMTLKMPYALQLEAVCSFETSVLLPSLQRPLILETIVKGCMVPRNRDKGAWFHGTETRVYGSTEQRQGCMVSRNRDKGAWFHGTETVPRLAVLPVPGNLLSECSD